MENDLRKFSQLASIDNPTKEQLIVLEEIKLKLKNVLFPRGKTLIEREVERDYIKDLIKVNKKLRSILKKSNI